MFASWCRQLVHERWFTNALNILWRFLHILRMAAKALKPVDWIGSSYKDFRAFPNDVQDQMGYALHLAQSSAKHNDAKPLKGFGGAGVLEVVCDRSRRPAARRRRRRWS